MQGNIQYTTQIKTTIKSASQQGVFQLTSSTEIRSRRTRGDVIDKHGGDVMVISRTAAATARRRRGRQQAVTAAASGDGGGNSGNSGDNGGGAAAVRLIMKGRRRAGCGRSVGWLWLRVEVHNGG